jgi:RNA polymerase sigma factor (sigma-70 family)
MLTRLIPLAKLDDARLAARIVAGDHAAFEALYDRHHLSLLAFCRHMLGNRQDGEDALQQTFIRAHRAMLNGNRPDEPRAWLFAIARNRCRTMLAARRDTVVDDAEEHDRVGVDGLTAEVQQRAELRELLADMTKLPEDQRAALLLTELRGFSHEQIALVIGCPAQKVKALVFQARTHLLAEREARDTECVEIRQQLEVARGGELRRGLLRRHLRRCEPCKTYSIAVTAQRSELAGLLPVLPSVGLKLSVLGAAGLMGGDGAAGAAGVAGGGGLAGGSGSAGVAAGGAGAAAGPGAAATVSGASVGAVAGMTTKLAVVKVAAVLAVSGGAAGAATAVVSRDGPSRERVSVERSHAAGRHSSSPAGRHSSSPAGRRAAGRGISATRRHPAAKGSRPRRQRSGTRRRARAGVGSRARARIDRRVRLRRAAKRQTTHRRATVRRPPTGSHAVTGSRRRATARRAPARDRAVSSPNDARPRRARAPASAAASGSAARNGSAHRRPRRSRGPE